MARRRNYNNSYNRNSAQSRMFSVSANNPYAFQNQFVGDSLSKGYEEEKSKRDEEFKVLQEERRLREEKLKDLSRTYIDQFPPGADVSDASKELGSIITQEMTKYRNDYGQLAIGYPKADVGSEQSGTIKAGMDEVISNANSLNNQVASWTEMKKDILEKASTNDYTNQFSKDSKNQEVAEELLEVFTGGVKAEIKDGKIGYESKQQGKFVTVKEMQRMLPFGKANDYAQNFLKIRQQVKTGVISKDALSAFTQPLRTNLDGEEGLKTALSLAADDVVLPGTALMSQTAIDNNGTEVESGFAYDFNGDRNLDLIETKMLMDAVYRGEKKAERILKDEIFRRLTKSLSGDADIYQNKLKIKTEKETQDKINAQLRLDQGKIELVERQKEKIKKEEERLTKEEATNLLINNNENYQDPVMKSTPKDFLKRQPNAPKETQKTIKGVKQYKNVDITTPEGFARNEQVLLEISQKANKEYGVLLEEGKVYIGPREIDIVTGKPKTDPIAGPFTTTKQILDWYLRTVADKK